LKSCDELGLFDQITADNPSPILSDTMTLLVHTGQLFFAILFFFIHNQCSLTTIGFRIARWLFIYNIVSVY